MKTIVRVRPRRRQRCLRRRRDHEPDLAEKAFRLSSAGCNLTRSHLAIHDAWSVGHDDEHFWMSLDCSKVRRFAVAGLIAVLVSASTALAWNGKGHMMIAYVAYQNLTPSVRARVDDLLQRSPYYGAWQMTIPVTVSDEEKRLRIFMLAATWPDQIKDRDSGYRDDGSDHGSRPNGASSSQNKGYADKLRDRYWHFVVMPFTSDGSPLPPIPTPNAQDRIHLFRSVLASATASDDLKSYDLTWLMHLVGDVHQPLHVATRVSATQPTGDQNGSLVSLCPRPAVTISAPSGARSSARKRLLPVPPRSRRRCRRRLRLSRPCSMKRCGLTRAFSWRNTRCTGHRLVRAQARSR